MSLVAYGSSDESNDESENESEVTQPQLKNVQTLSKSKDTENEFEEEQQSTLFSVLPKPRTQIQISGDENQFSSLLMNKQTLTVQNKNKATKEPVKISIPSLSDFQNDDEEAKPAKKFKPSQKGSGLMSILPQPKNTLANPSKKSLIPDVLKKQKAPPVPTPVRVPVSASAPRVVAEDDNVGDEEIQGNQFFSFLNKNSTFTSNVNADPSPVVAENAWGAKDNNADRMVINPASSSIQEVEVPNNEEQSDFVPFQNNSLELDEKALQILCGNKNKRQKIPMNIIDVSGEEIMPDSKEWLLKQFTDEKSNRGHSHRKTGGPSTQSRRKHQITYLAYQAKEQELELQNQWANNRMSRKQTQSKYGF